MSIDHSPNPAAQLLHSHENVKDHPQTAAASTVIKRDNSYRSLLVDINGRIPNNLQLSQVGAGQSVTSAAHLLCTDDCEADCMQFQQMPASVNGGVNQSSSTAVDSRTQSAPPNIGITDSSG